MLLVTNYSPKFAMKKVGRIPKTGYIAGAEEERELKYISTYILDGLFCLKMLFFIYFLLVPTTMIRTGIPDILKTWLLHS